MVNAMVESGEAGITRTLLVSLILGAVLLIALRAIQRDRIIDDAYITYRYARNLVEGQGFRYNPGPETPPVLGTTTPLYTLLLSGLGLVFGSGSIPAVSVNLNRLCDLGTYLLLFLLVRRLSGLAWLGVLAAWLFACNDWVIEVSCNGMETSLYMLGIAATILLFVQKRDFRAFVLVGVVLFTRPDGLILYLAAFLYLLYDGRLRSARWLVVPPLVVLPWVVFAWQYFGSPIPHSMQAKGTGVYTIHPLQAFFHFLIQFPSYILPMGTIDNYLWDRVHLLAWAVILCLPVLYFARRQCLRGKDYDLPALYFGGYAAAFVLGNPLLLGWYRVPMELFYIVSFTLGGWWLFSRAVRWFGWSAARGAAWFSAVMLLSQLVQYALYKDSAHRLHPPQFRYVVDQKTREHAYRAAALEVLVPRVTADTVVASPEIGAIGYYTPCAILDTVGLVSPEARRYYPYTGPRIGNYGIPPEMILDLRPDYLVTLPIFAHALLAPDSPFHRMYRMLPQSEMPPKAREFQVLVFERLENGRADP